MKYLNQFLEFRLGDFLRDKQLTVTGISEYTDYTSGKHIGSKVEVAITTDGTPYKHQPGKEGSNLYEKFVLKCTKDIDIPIGTIVMPKNAHASVYGDRRDKLSVLCDDIVVMKGE